MSQKNRTSGNTSIEDIASEDTEALEIPAAKDTATAPVAPTLEKAVASSPVPEYIALRVFATIAGPKWDQMAGFVSHARRMKLGPLTMEAWQTEFKKFQEKPVG